MDKEYWENVINQLLDKNKANFAAHVLSSNTELLDEICAIIGKEKIIRNCLLCYGVDFSSQTYLDEILIMFSLADLIKSYQQLEQKPIEVAGAFMWLLEDIDPTFKWTSKMVQR